MPTTTVLHLCAANDENGNTMRCYVALNEGVFVGAWDESYEGYNAVPLIYRREAKRSISINVPQDEVKRFLAWHEALS